MKKFIVISMLSVLSVSAFAVRNDYGAGIVDTVSNRANDTIGNRAIANAPKWGLIFEGKTTIYNSRQEREAGLTLLKRSAGFRDSQVQILGD